ncbi:MAG: hypothetical protein AMXMBFR53_36780 [Gemmatimonadota bacterium]
MKQPIPVEHYLAEFLEVAKSIGGTPRFEHLGPRLMSGLARNGFTLPRAAQYWGLTPNVHRHPIQPLPLKFRDPVAEQAVTKRAVDVPRPPHALSRDELAREREAHCRRMAEKWGREPWAMPGYRGYRKPDGRMRSDFGSRERDLLRGHDDYLPPTDLVAWFQGRAA